MNDLTRKILIGSALCLSIIALGLTIVVFKRQLLLIEKGSAKNARLINKISSKLEAKPTAPARVISAKSGNTWLDVQKQVKDTVVQIFSHVAEFNWLEPYKTPEQSEGAGSGFFINDQGDIISNYHVIAQASSVEIQIPSFGLERFDVEIVGVSPERDIALLKLSKEAVEKIKRKLGKIPWLKLGDSDRILRSQEVLALGYPLGQSRLKSTLGIVSGRERIRSAGYIQITAPLNPGNSGGPAVDTDGEVIGINSAGVLEAQNVGYIIPINEVRSALKDLYKTKLLRKPTLGCIFTAATPEMVDYLGNPYQGGWYIAKVFEGTLLEKVGIKEGDMLYEINGHSVDLYGEIDVPWSEDKASLFEFLNRLTVGDTLNFVIYRKGQRKTFSFKFKATYLPPVRMIYPEFEPEAIDYEIIGGLVVMQLTLNHVGIMLSRVPDLVRYGKIEVQHESALVITHVFPNSQTFKARVLRPGELITEINGDKVKTLADFRQAVMKSLDSRYLSVRTEDNLYAIMSLDKILRDENMLSARYFFRKSKLFEMLDRRPLTKPDLTTTTTTTTPPPLTN
jgi:serine protease Do